MEIKKHWLDTLEKDDDLSIDSIPKPLLIEINPPIWKLSQAEIDELIKRLNEQKQRLLNQ